jgi:lipopolysaccharide/colanic/teichoic acid biosynthesis glycosyltransferase/GGDEF domain-containing protein
VIYSQPQFLERLIEERNRSDRTRSPFTLVVLPVDASHLDTANGNGIYHTVDALARTMRRSDLWGHYGHDKLGLLLTDTNEVAARRLISRLAHHVSVHTNSEPPPLKLKPGRYSLIEYPKTLEQYLVKEIVECSEPTEDPASLEGNGGRTLPGNGRGELSLLEQTSLSARRMAHGFNARFYEKGKRCIDVAGAIVGLLITAIASVPIALLIKTTSRGPVLFKQKRIGRKGQEFTFLKYRTMYHNCDQTLHKEYMERLIRDEAEKRELKGETYYKLADDPRITPVGRYLRKGSIDELPQFYNVLRGEMSLVGPRPPIAYEVRKYEAWQLRRILEAKPGITGLWQVSGRSTMTFKEQVRLDLRYLENQSLWQDIKILFKTIKVVFVTKDAV